MRTKEHSFFIKNIGPFKVNGIDLKLQRFIATSGYYETKDGVNIGNVIVQNIHRFDQEGNFLSPEKWIYQPLDNYYWWVTNGDKIRIEVYD